MRPAEPLPSGRAAALLAIREGWPVLVTPVLVGLPFGVLAREAGLDLPQTVGMSLLVFAGAAQFAAIGMLRDGVPAALIVLTVLLINLRHLLMAVALRPHFVGRGVPARLALGYLLTDEAFAMGAGWARRGGRSVAYYLAFAVALWAAWNAATLAGALAGAAAPDPRTFGLDFAITATFIAIVVLSVRERRDVYIALAAAIAAGLMRGSGLAVVAVVLAGALAPLVPGVLRRWT